jgi:hypothetical protein
MGRRLTARIDALIDGSPSPDAITKDHHQCRLVRRATGIDIVIAAAIIVVLAAPVLFTNRAFMIDLTNDLWMGSVMSHSLPHGIPPTFFLNTNSFGTNGIFSPIFAFYGGPFFALFGALIAILGGSVTVAFEVLVVLAFSAAYSGSFWISRQCGLRGRLPHFPAITIVSAAYYLTDLYGRSDIPEFVALSMIPLVVASVTHLIRSRSWTPGPILLLSCSVVVFTGSHNITLLWGTLISGVTAMALALVLRPRGLPIRRICAVAGLIILATLVNAWYLIPDIAFSGTTLAAAQAGISVTFFDTIGLLFDPLRAVPSQSRSPALYVQAPVWFLVWSVGCGVWIWCRQSLKAFRKSWSTLFLVLVAVTILIVDTSLWRWVPAKLQVVQFPYRLNGYVLLLVGALVLVGLLAVQHEADTKQRSFIGSALIVALAGVTVMSMALAVWQEWVPRSCPSGGGCVANRSAGLTTTHVLPPTWVEVSLYTNPTAPVVPVRSGRSFDFPPDLVDPHGDRLAATVDPPSGTRPFVTNITGGPQLVSIGGGIERLGRTGTGFVVVRRVKPGGGPIRVVIQTASSPVIALGRWMTLVGAIGIAVWASLSVLSVRRSRHSRPGRHRVRGPRPHGP